MSYILRATNENIQPTPVGFYNFHTSPDEALQYRLHLRVLPDENGILIVNASSVLRLNRTGTYFAWQMMQNKTEEEIIQAAVKRYKAEESTIRADVQNFVDEIKFIITNPDQAPVFTDSGFDNLSSDLGTKLPMRVNLCLTQRFSMGEVGKEMTELSTEQWRTLIQKTFNAGIPQIIFFGGEPTLRSDLLDLLGFAEELGLVTGLVTASARLWQDHAYLEELITNGLDHLVLEFDPEKNIPVAELETIFSQDLFTCVRFPVHSWSQLFEWAMSLKNHGANALSLYATELESHDVASHLIHQLENKEIVIEYDLPSPLNADAPAEKSKLFSPELEDHENEMYYSVLPDGSVCGQETPQIRLGNLLNAAWEQILLKNSPLSENK